MKTIFHDVRQLRGVCLSVAARRSRMGFTVRGMMVGVALVAGSVAGCMKPGPENSRLARGSEAVLYDPKQPTVEFLGQYEPPSFPGDSNPMLVKVPVGTRVQVDNDVYSNLERDRGVGITILEGEYKGQSTTFPRYQLRPATQPSTPRPEPAPDSPAPTSPANKLAPDSPVPAPPADKPAPDSPTPADKPAPDSPTPPKS